MPITFRSFKPFRPQNGKRKFKVIVPNGTTDPLNITATLIYVLRYIFDNNKVTEELFNRFRNATPHTRYYWSGRRLLSTRSEIEEHAQRSSNPDDCRRRFIDNEPFNYNNETYYTHGEIGDCCIALFGWLNYDLRDKNIKIVPFNFDLPEQLIEIQEDDFRRIQIPGSDRRESSDENEGDQMPIYSRNHILFGAPGTGKSRKLNDEVKRWFVDAIDNNCFERVTFYPTYSYAQFVGTYKPVMRLVNNDEKIAYEFVPGPFLRVLVKALNESFDDDGEKKDWCLVIEEINRANAAAVFGDVFQLLDRDENGVSEYMIAASEDIKKFLQKEITTIEGKKFLGVIKESDEGNENENWDLCSLRIPGNMYIWATMNSADQGVFPMDTAFKRRWEFDNIGIDDEANGECSNWTIEGKEYKWNEIRRYINGLLAEHDVNEDKFMGPYFIKANSNNVVSKKMFASKVLMYLWEDAGRMIRRNLFGNNIKTYSKLVETWEREDVGVKVFEQCNKKENLSADLKALYANWTMPPPAE